MPMKTPCALTPKPLIGARASFPPVLNTTLSPSSDFTVATIVAPSAMKAEADEAAEAAAVADGARVGVSRPHESAHLHVTGEATYARVAEAAESALDGYLIKPFEMFEIDAVINNAMRVRTSVQDSGTPMIAHKHVTRPAQVKLRSTSNRERKRYAMSARVAAVVAFILVSAFGAGASIKPAKVVEPTAAEEMFGKDSKPIVVPIMMDKTVYLNR